MRHTLLALLVLGAFGTGSVPAQERRSRPVVVNNPMRVDPAEYISKIKLPPGFRISLYAPQVQGARSLALSPNGTLFVGTFRMRRSAPGKVYAVLDDDGDLRADRVLTLAEGLNMPNGVAWRDGDLYVAEVSRILKFPDIEAHLEDPPEPEVVTDAYPSNRWHGWKFIRFGPDGKLYVPVGAPCNVCERENEIFATITRINPDGSGLEIFARGIRNTVGFDWHPVTGELWFTDNGRDEWGDDLPPDELNRAPRAGLHFGFPYRYGKSLVDTTFQTTLPDTAFQPAVVEIPAHSAALGMRFYTGTSFPPEYHNQIFIAEHGSWNRSKPIGYQVSLVRLGADGTATYEPFATGWLIDDRYWGRPVDVEILHDGSLLVSDDFAGCVYRIWYER